MYEREKRKGKRRVSLHRQSLTRGLVAVRLQGNVVPLLPPLRPRDLFHLVDLRQAQLGVVMEEEFPPCDSEVVFTPVPELAEILVVQGVK